MDHLLHIYGSETGKLLGYSKANDNALERITPGAPDLWAQVYHAIREEWALTAEDVIYRRTTLGLRGFDTPGIRHEDLRSSRIRDRRWNPAPELTKRPLRAADTESA